MKTTKEIATNLRRKLLSAKSELNMTYDDISKRCGVSIMTICKLFKQPERSNTETLIMVCRVLGIEIVAKQN